jgi:hypothetical protein
VDWTFQSPDSRFSMKEINGPDLILALTAAIKSRNRISRFWGFRCQVNWTFQSPDSRLMAYLPRNFCRSDGCRPFGKFEWDPTVTGSLSPFFSANSYILSFAARVFFNVVPPELLRPNPQGILSFLSCHLHCCHQ